jgi:hypothetical protein
MRDSAFAQVAKKPNRAVGRGFIPGTRSIESARALQAAEKLARTVGRGFIPGTKPIKSMRALAPEVRFSNISPEIRPFSAASLAPYSKTRVAVPRNHDAKWLFH